MKFSTETDQNIPTNSVCTKNYTAAVRTYEVIRDKLM